MECGHIGVDFCLSLFYWLGVLVCLLSYACGLSLWWGTSFAILYLHIFFHQYVLSSYK